MLSADSADEGILKTFLSRIPSILASTTHDNAGLSISASNLQVQPSANVFRKVIQNFNAQSLSFQLDSAIADRDTQLENIAINLGAAKARYENQIQINGSGAHVTMYSLSVAEDTQEFDQRTFQTHNAPNSVSDLLYKNLKENLNNRADPDSHHPKNDCDKSIKSQQTNHHISSQLIPR